MNGNRWYGFRCLLDHIFQVTIRCLVELKAHSLEECSCLVLKPSQPFMSGEVINPKEKPTIAIFLNQYSVYLYSKYLYLQKSIVLISHQRSFLPAPDRGYSQDIKLKILRIYYQETQAQLAHLQCKSYT